MDIPSTEVSTFLTAVAATPGLWLSLDVRSIAVFSGGEWHSLVTRCQLDSRSPGAIPRVPFLPVTDKFACRQMVIPADGLEPFLGALCEGHVTMDGVDTVFMVKESNAPNPAPYRVGSVNLAMGRGPFPVDSEPFPTAHRLTFYGGSHGLLLTNAGIDREALNTHVSTLDRPWDGLDSLTEHALHTTARVDHHVQGTVEVVAPLEAMLDGCELRSGTLQYSILTGSRAAAERCGVKLFGIDKSGSIVSESLQPRGKWSRVKDDAGYRRTSTYKAANTLRTTVLLHLGPFVVDRQTVVDPAGVGQNPRVVAYGQFDASLERLTQITADPNTAKREEFHSVVQRLFVFAGFAVDTFVADPSLSGKGIPDFLAHAPGQGVLFVVECTAGPLASEKGKLGWLVLRARRVERALAGISGDRVVPVMVTAEEGVPHELEAASRSRVAVLTRQHLGELLRFALAQTPLQRVVAWFEGQVPPSTSGPGKAISRKRS